MGTWTMKKELQILLHYDFTPLQSVRKAIVNVFQKGFESEENTRSSTARWSIHNSGTLQYLQPTQLCLEACNS
jgi:hypothetical protein